MVLWLPGRRPIVDTCISVDVGLVHTVHWQTDPSAQSYSRQYRHRSCGTKKTTNITSFNLSWHCGVVVRKCALWPHCDQKATLMHTEAFTLNI